MNSKLLKGILVCLALSLSSSTNATLIISVDSVVENTMGDYPSINDIEYMINQQGLSSNYISGLTDFESFTSSDVVHTQGHGDAWYSDSRVYSGFFIFDLGAEYLLQSMVMWNAAGGINASVSSFSLTTSSTPDFISSSFAGEFTGSEANYLASVYDLTDSIARYIRMDIDGNFGNPCCTVIGEIAFGGQAVNVTAPPMLLLLTLTLFGLTYRRKINN